MSGDILPFLYGELAYGLVLNLVFGIIFLRKVIKLDKLSDNLSLKVPRRDWIKFSIILLLIALMVLHLILAYSSSTYWLSDYPNFSLIIFFYAANYTMQAYMVLKLGTKGIGNRFIPNYLYWILCMVVALIQIIIIEKMSETQKIGSALQLVIAIMNFSLFLISLIFDQVTPAKDILKTLRSDSDTGRTIQDSIHRWDKVHPSNRLFVQFNQQFQVNQQKQVLVCVFKLAVYVDQSVNIISKTDFDFNKLSSQMVKIFPHKSEAVLQESTKKYKNMMEYGEERLKYNQSYLLELIKSGQFIIPCLLDFLQVPATIRSKLIMNDFLNIVRQETGESSEDQKLRKPFFKVYCEKGKIVLQNPDFLEFVINRPLEDIMQLNNRLREQQRITIQILPEYPIMEDLIAFFSIVVNKKSLWRTFSAWFRLDIQLQNKVYNYFDPWTIGFRNIKVDIIGHEVVFDIDAKMHTCYLISLNGNISRNNSHHSEAEAEKRGVIIKKRFSQFCTLDKHIRRFMNKRKISLEYLPSLPPKFSPFGSKTSPKSRQMRFGIYLKGLLHIEGINNCIKLLQFLEFDTINSMQQMSQSIQVNKQDEYQSQLSYFSQLNQRT